MAVEEGSPRPSPVLEFAGAQPASRALSGVRNACPWHPEMSIASPVWRGRKRTSLHPSLVELGENIVDNIKPVLQTLMLTGHDDCANAVNEDVYELGLRPGSLG